MRSLNISTYFIALLAFPLWFFLHVVNENFWLIPFSTLVGEILPYTIITIAIGAVCLFLMRDRYKAFFISGLLLLLFFLFGAFKDAVDQLSWIKFLRSYSVLLPLLAFLVGLALMIVRRSVRSFEKAALFLVVFILFNLVVDAALISYKLFSNAKAKNDHGDHDQTLIKDLKLSQTTVRPDVYWLVFDEYAASNSMEKAWGFKNPLDSSLRNKGFFVADSAASNYNYTPYSLLSTLDMLYLREYGNHSHVNATDIAKSTYAVKTTNAISLFKKLGYNIHNYSIYNFKDHPTKGEEFFSYLPASIINTRTFTGRIRKDIGWNFNNFFASDKTRADSIRKWNALVKLDETYDALIDRSFKAIGRPPFSPDPGFYLFHFQLPHEPYMYDSTGAVQYRQAIDYSAKSYLSHLRYTNKIVQSFADSILHHSKGRDLVIIISGDHGFKFDESDVNFETESCRILYAIYCSDRNYSAWYRSISSVNSFRVIFNKYYNTGFPILKDTSFNLLYRQD